MLKVLTGGWTAGYGSSGSGSSGSNSSSAQTSTSALEHYDDSDEPPAFPLPGSIQRAGTSSTSAFHQEDAVEFHVSPPSPSESATSSSRASSPATPRASTTSSSHADPFFARPKPSHRAFAPEPDHVTQPRQSASGRTGGSSSGLALPPSTTAPPPKRSKKVALKPGHSALDWARLCREGGDDLTAGFDRPQRITLSEVAEHKKRDDAWSVFNGKVYNITPYLHYHPGGIPELMRVAGRDGTELFMKTHAWVNADLMMEACLIGYLVRE